jgi:UDP-glucuronate 4-epimerase
VAEFYSARSGTIPPLPWQTFAPPFSRLYNVGNSHPVEVLELVRVIEQVIGRPAIPEFLPMQPGDVLETCADSSDLERAVGFRPNTPIEEGARLFVEWLRTYRCGKE